MAGSTAGTDSIAQASAVPYRRTKRGVEFCLVTSIKKGRWGFPKGIIDPGDTAPQTARKEAAEEAGISGRVLQSPLGHYSYGKWGTTLNVTVYLMRVTSSADEWPERAQRKRAWVSAREAKRRLSRNDLRQMVDVALRRINSRRTPPPRS